LLLSKNIDFDIVKVDAKHRWYKF